MIAQLEMVNYFLTIIIALFALTDMLPGKLTYKHRTVSFLSAIIINQNNK